MKVNLYKIKSVCATVAFILGTCLVSVAIIYSLIEIMWIAYYAGIPM